ncbi:diiron oxygenase [Micromonospora sp. FIMYZ51]|uniref:diiron oxygenase n=1 Tax=Micromonospora sp. FIMYZ51 TaxID=3051832 RepID=UPI00311FC00C
MFVGCAALTFCPRKLALPDPADIDGAGTTGPGVDQYRSPFRSWDTRATVRQAERRVLSEGADDGRFFFPPELVPVTRHPLVQALPPEVFDSLLVQHLYRFLDFTAKLETLVVNRTVLGIAHGSVGIDVPEEMRFDAYKIYCDEAYHALFSVDLARQVTDRTGIAPRLPAQPFFLQRLSAVLEDLAPAERPLAELLFVIVSETLITAYLADVPAADSVEPAVRATIRDHAIDEGRHHAYFAVFLRYLWGQLDRAQRRRAALLVPRLIDAFVRPDTAAMTAELTGYGLSRQQAEQVVAEIYTPDILRAHAAGTARQTVAYLRELEAFGDPAVIDECHRYGLLPDMPAGTVVGAPAVAAERST